MSSAVKRTGTVILVILIAMVLVFAALQLTAPSKKNERVATWTLELQGSYAKSVKVNNDGSLFVWMVDDRRPNVVHRSDIFGIASNGTPIWHRTYYNIWTVTYGGPSLMIIGGSHNQSMEENFLIGIDEFNRTKMVIPCGSFTPTSIAPSIDMGIFTVGFTADQYDPNSEKAGQHILKKFWANGTVQWEKPCAESSLKYMPNGTLTVWDQKGVRGLDTYDGDLTWSISFGNMDVVTLATYDAFYGSCGNRSVQCIDVNGSVRWTLELRTEVHLASVDAVDASGRAYCYVMPVARPMYLDQVLTIGTNGSVIFNKTTMRNAMVGTGDGVMIIIDRTITSFDGNGTVRWVLETASWDVSAWYDLTYQRTFVITADPYDASAGWPSTSILACYDDS